MFASKICQISCIFLCTLSTFNLARSEDDSDLPSFDSMADAPKVAKKENARPPEDVAKQGKILKEAEEGGVKQKAKPDGIKPAAKAEKPQEINMQAIAESGNSDNSSIFDSILKKIKKTISFSNKKEKVKKVVKPENPAKAFPDPLFSEVVYHENAMFDTYLFMYNDKSNHENLHIPMIQFAAINHELLQLSRGLGKQENLMDLLDGVRNSTLYTPTVKYGILNSGDENGSTPLLFLIRSGNISGIKAILRAGADPNVCNKFRVCPIHLAVYNERTDILLTLLQYDVDIDAKDRYNVDVVKHTIINGMNDIFDILIEYAYIHKKQSQDGVLDLMEFAVKEKKMEFAEFLYYKFGFDKIDKEKEEQKARDDAKKKVAKSKGDTKVNKNNGKNVAKKSTKQAKLTKEIGQTKKPKGVTK